MSFRPPPATACWQHLEARSGFEVAYFQGHADGWTVDGTTAAYVRALDLGVARLEQAYRRIADDGPRQRFDYAAPAFGFTSRLVYDESGLVLDYPGIARRAG